jgi:Leucine-rich repeat (LRR) protein
LRFLPNLTSLKLVDCELISLAPIMDLPRLLRFSISGDDQLEDYTPLASCRQLRRLKLHPGCAWPELGDLANLVNLEELRLGRNPWQIEDLGRRSCFPKLLSASFHTGFPLRDARNLPAMPVIRRLAVQDVCRLDGFERFPSLEELTVNGSFQDARPVSELPKLTHLSFNSATFQDVEPLKHLPELRHFTMFSGKPRDYSPLVESPKLHRISATGDGALVNQMELATLNAALSPWDEDFALAEPRPWGGPYRLICVDDFQSLNAIGSEDRLSLDTSENLEPVIDFT